MLYTPECFVEYPDPDPDASSSTKPGVDKHASSKTSTASSSSASGKKKAGGGGGGAGSSSPGDDAVGGGSEVERKPVYYGVDEARKRVALKCTSCSSQGALIGCHVQSCQVNTHYACAIREGWKFGEPDADGKVGFFVLFLRLCVWLCRSSLFVMLVLFVFCLCVCLFVCFVCVLFVCVRVFCLCLCLFVRVCVFLCFVCVCMC